MAPDEGESSNVMRQISPTAETAADSSGGGKVKQTRRRQRLSCVECTKRRQKCDRRTPCGLCVSRGIPDLCRWEAIVVRPTPQRPPTIARPALASQEADATIQTLNARVAALEQALARQNTQPSERSNANTLSSLPPPDLTPLPHNLPVPKPTLGLVLPSSSSGEPRALIDYNMQVAAVALAQLSLAPKAEYVGSGTVLCAIHRLGDPESYRAPYPRTLLTTTQGSDPHASHPALASIRQLVAQLPSRSETEVLVDRFFATRNGEFGLSEAWFRNCCQQMWIHIDLRCAPDCIFRGGCTACKEEINPHWLALLFAVMAITPKLCPKQSSTYFSSSVQARRLVEDLLLGSSSNSFWEGAVHGGTLGCLAAALLSAFLADCGRVSEAWKMCGNAIRTAISLGLHRDPRWSKWEAMSPGETELRVLTWWLLVIGDRFYSFMLGRPPMTIQDLYGTKLLPSPNHPDGSQNIHATFQVAAIELSQLIRDATAKILYWESTTYEMITELDRRFQEWEIRLPQQLKWRLNPPKPTSFSSALDANVTLSSSDKFVPCHRVYLAAWYLDGLMGVHRVSLYGKPGALGYASMNPSRDRCIEIAMELTRVLCAHYAAFANHGLAGLKRIAPNLFAYFLFDGAVALAGTLSQDPPHPQAVECLRLMERAMNVLDEIAHVAPNVVDGERDYAKRGLKILGALRKAAGCGMKDQEKGDLVSLSDVLHQQYDATQVVPHLNETNASRNDGIQTSNMTAYDSASSSSTHSTSPPFTPPSAFLPESHFQRVLPPDLNHQSTTSSSNSTTMSNAQVEHQQLFAIGGGGGMAMPTYSGVRPALPSVARPYEILQGVQPSIQELPMQFDIDWARLAGMENYYSGGISTLVNQLT